MVDFPKRETNSWVQVCLAMGQNPNRAVLSSLGHLREYLGKQQTVDYLFTLLSVLLKSVAAEHVQVHSCTGLEPESTPPSFEIEQQRKCRQVLQPALIPYAHPLHVENGHYTSVVHANCYSLRRAPL